MRYYTPLDLWKEVLALISITQPDDDICIQAQDHMKIPKNKGGIYKIYNENDEIMYIGKAACLRQRICQHMGINSGFSDVNHNFRIVRCIYVDDPYEREIYETFLINIMRPPLNWDKVFTYKSERYNDRFKTQDTIEQEKFEKEIRMKEIAEKMKNRPPLDI